MHPTLYINNWTKGFGAAIARYLEGEGSALLTVLEFIFDEDFDGPETGLAEL